MVRPRLRSTRRRWSPLRRCWYQDEEDTSTPPSGRSVSGSSGCGLSPSWARWPIAETLTNSREQGGIPPVSPALYLIDTSALCGILQDKVRQAWKTSSPPG